MLISDTATPTTNRPAVLRFLERVLDCCPTEWLELTTHRLDIYDEPRAKAQFLEQFDALFQTDTVSQTALEALPTAYDYIRLGHPLSCVLEWGLARLNQYEADQVISFASVTMPILAILRTNTLAKKPTRLVYTDALPAAWDSEVLRSVYQYDFELEQVQDLNNLSEFEGTTVLLAASTVAPATLPSSIDFLVQPYWERGSVVFVRGAAYQAEVAAIQHVRRRESIAMTPADCLAALQLLVGRAPQTRPDIDPSKTQVLETLQAITGAAANALVASSGLSMQYAIMMGLIHQAQVQHPGQAIKVMIPPNCYGGTNDQARRIAAVLDQVEIVDLLVDRDQNMVQSIDVALDQIAAQNAVPFIIAEIPTNPRVEVPDLERLGAVLSKERLTPTGQPSLMPIFILDQTFCPNVPFLALDSPLASVPIVSYASGSKFPSGGRCTAGYCVANHQAESLLPKIEQHLTLCDNAATPLQLTILAEQLPSMLDRIEQAYHNTRALVNFIEQTLPEANINFVSEELAAQGFTPSVFSLDLPTKGATDAERETFKRALNEQLIGLMIHQIPTESKFCVSYGQLKGCYWTIPATSTQGTTKEADKDYIVRVAVSPNLDMERHKAIFKQFVAQLRAQLAQ